VIDKHKKIKDQSVDFYLPETSLAFEFQGGQHYFQTHVGSFAGYYCHSPFIVLNMRLVSTIGIRERSNSFSN
jgi:hypothetical protein